MSLPVSNVVRVTVLSALRGLADVNTSMLGLITDEAPIPNDFGDFRVYKDPLGVIADFGTDTETARLAEKVFGQTPNILTGNGALIVVPRDPAAAASAATILSASLVDFSQLTATDYNINLNIDGGGAGDLLIGEIDTTSIATITASLNSTAVSAAGATFSVSGELSSAKVTLVSDTAGATSSLVTTTAGTGTDLLSLLGIEGPAIGAASGVETIKDCIIRTVGFVPYFGLIYNEKMTDVALKETASLVQSLNLIQFVGSNLSADLTPTTGIFDIVKESGWKQTRCLYYSNSENDALDFAAGYASSGLSVNFSGVNTMLTMNLKEITGLVGDPVFSTTNGQTRYNECAAAGVDCYADYGVPGVASVGGNDYFDEVYIRLALKLQLQVAGFNLLKQTNTKITQTETGVDSLKSAYRRVLKKFVTNGSFAAGTWIGTVIFGDPENHRRNIEEFGYWMYSLPVNQQTATDRDARIAPVVQIACKASGAIHSSDVTVYIER